MGMFGECRYRGGWRELDLVQVGVTGNMVNLYSKSSGCVLSQHSLLQTPTTFLSFLYIT